MVINVALIGGGIFIAAFLLYSALAFPEINRLILAGMLLATLVVDYFIYRLVGARIRRFHRHARTGLPALIFDRRGVWVHERTGEAPIPWVSIDEVEEMGAGKNQAIQIRTRPGTSTADKPITIAAGFYDAEFDDIAAALMTVRERYR